MIMHATELGLESIPSGIVVVADLFEGRGDAPTWASRHDAGPDDIRDVRLLTLNQFKRVELVPRSRAGLRPRDRSGARERTGVSR